MTSVFDYNNLRSYIKGHSKFLKMKHIEIDERALEGICTSLESELTGPLKHASAFKQASQLYCYFIAASPIKTLLPPEGVGKDVAIIANYSNIYMIFSYIRLILSKAWLLKDNEKIKITNRIQLSRHSYCDLLWSSVGITPQMHFPVFAVLFEQLVYRSNPEISYEIDVT